MPLTDQQKTRAVELYDAGVKTEDIWKETGVSRPSLYMILRQQGRSPDRQRRDRRFVPELDASHLLRRVEALNAALGACKAELASREEELATAHARISELEEQLGSLAYSE